MDCADILNALEARRVCEPSPYGTKVATGCLYPSASPVYVHVSTWGDGFRVSDGGEAAQCVLKHGRDHWAAKAGLKAAAARYSLLSENEELFAIADNIDWLPNVVAAVANGAAFAANTAVEQALHRQQKTLKDRIEENLRSEFPDLRRRLVRDYQYRGKSGKVWDLDFAIVAEQLTLIKSVTPHHNSIAATYTALSDIASQGNRRLSVYQKRPKEDDAALLRQVAELVPFAALAPTVKSLRFHH